MGSIADSLLAEYLFSLLYRLHHSDSFYSQVRAVEGLAAVLSELGDPMAAKILEEAVKYEEKAIVLDTYLAEVIDDIQQGNVASLPESVKNDLVRLRLALEKFKAHLLVALDESVSRRIKRYWGGESGS